MQAPAEVSEQLPPPGVAVLVPPERVAENWPSLAGLFGSLTSWSQILAPEDMRAPLTNGALKLFAVRDSSGAIYIATAALFLETSVRSCVAWLFVGHEAPESMASALVDEIETFARVHACTAFSINAFPGIAPRIRGHMTSVIIERDLRIKHKELN